MDTYIRISRKGDRDGLEYRTPHIQRDEIKRWAGNSGIKQGMEVVDEDVSGGKAVKDRGLELLLERAEEGASGGVITYRMNRFGRDHLENLLAIKRLKDAGARLVGVQDGVDTDQPQGKWLMNMMSLQAEDELDRIKANWEASTSRAVADGIHIACRAPTGLLRTDQVDPRHDAKGRLIRDGRLVEDPELFDIMSRAFLMRSEGEPYSAILATIPRPMAKSTLASIFKNRAYLGEARGPNGAVCKDAHPAVTTPEIFRRCKPGSRVKPTGLAAGALLGGLVFCAECGHRMQIVGATNKSSGKRTPNYVCCSKWTGRECSAAPSVSVARVDAWVVETFENSQDEIADSVGSAEALWLGAKDALDKAEAALDDWVSNTAIQQSLSKQRFQKGIIDRQAAVDEAQQKLWDLPDPGIDAGKPIVELLPGKKMVVDDDVRAMLRRYVRAVTVTKADPKRRRWQPIDERVAIEWVGGVTVEPIAATASAA